MNEEVKKIRRERHSKTTEIVIAAVLVMIILMITVVSLGEKKEKIIVSENGYSENIERRLSVVLSEIEGAGEVEVFVNAETDGEKIVATESIRSPQGETTTKPILSGGKPIVLEEKSPKITGVLIVAEGADDLNVRFNLMEAVASVLNINQGIIKVYAKGMK